MDGRREEGGGRREEGGGRVKERRKELEEEVFLDMFLDHWTL